MGTEEYLSQNNDNVDFLKQNEKFKFIDDLSILEILNLLSIGLASYNYHNHVPSDVGIENLYLDPRNIQSQEHLQKISRWTMKNKMKLNTTKSNYMIFNFSKNYKFNTRLTLEGENLEELHETKLLGLKIRADLSWKSNTSVLTRKAYSRMLIIKKLVQFDVPLEDLLHIYGLYIRSVTEQSAVVWHSAITKGEKNDLERVQKVALRIILGPNYTTYSEALKFTGLDTLSNRRRNLCLKFAKKCVINESTSWMFPRNQQIVNTRNPEVFHVTKAKTNRLANSAIPYMQKLLNDHYSKKKLF